MKPTSCSIIPRFACVVLFTAMAAWSARADYSSTVLSHNPLAYWRLDETAASPPLNVLTNKGSVGAPGNGILVRKVTKGQAGVVGNSILLVNGGSGSIDCRAKVDVPYTNALNPPAPWSVEFWANPNRNDQTLAALSAMNCQFNGGGSRMGWLFYENGSANWQFRLGGIAGYIKILSSSVAPALNTWTHLVGTFDGTTAQLYVNGVLSASGAVPGWSPNTAMPIMFGAFPLDGGGGDTIDGPAPSFGGIAGYRGFDGNLDEVAIYTNVLSAATIAAHYGLGSTNNAGYGAQILLSNPIGYWNCDEPAVSAPSPSTFPLVSNVGTLGSAVNGTNYWGDLAAQSGPGYAGLGGASDKACFFDGDNGYIALKDDPGMHFTNGPGLITMMAWVKPTSINYYRNIIGHGWDGGYIETFLRLSQGDDGRGGGTGTNYYEAGISLDGTIAGYDNNVARYPIPDGDLGNWVHVAATYDGSAWNIYRNGRLVAQKVTPNGAVDVTNRWSIGSRSSPSPTDGSAFYGNLATFESEGLFFNGYIDEPAIFTNALSSTDISNIYTAALVPPVFTRALQNPGTVFKGSAVPLSFWAEGSPTLGFYWTSNSVQLAVATTNFTISNIPTGTFNISVTVTNAYGTNSSSVTFVSVTQPPFISTSPGPETRFVGFPFNFSVTAGGTVPLTYYWYFGSTLVQSGASASYGGTASLGNAGSYKVVVSNETGISVTSSPAILTVNPIPSGYPSNVIASGPIAYWRLDESSGTVAHDGIGGNDGIYNSTALGVQGYSVLDPDTAASFSGLNSYVGSISGTAINFPGFSSFTLEAWVNAEADQSDQATIIAKGIGNNLTTPTEQFALDVAGGAYRFYTTFNNTHFEADGVTGPNGSWQHLVAVFDGSTSNLYLYVNGAQEGVHAGPPSGLNTTTTPVSIGSKRTGNPPDYDGTFNGTIDEVAVYNYAMSPATIQAHFAAAYGTTLAPIINVEPTSVTNYAGLNSKFTIVAAGSVPLSYQWKKGGSDIGGATASTLSFSPLATSDQGTYSVHVANGVGSTNSVTVSLTVLPPPTNPPDISGLVLHLAFETNLTDVTGRGNNGTGYNSTTNSTNVFNPNPGIPAFHYVSDGALGAALHYSTDAINTGGTTSTGTNDYYVSLGLRPDLQFSSNVSFTVAYWVRLPLSYSGGDLPFFGTAVGSEGQNGFVFAPAYGYGTADSNPNPAPQNFGGWGLSVYGGATGVRIYGDVVSINDNIWHNLVHVVNHAAGTITTYLDGNLAHSTVAGGTTLGAAGNIDNGAAAVIGQDPTGRYGEAGEFDIDDLGVWRKALSPLEAASIYAAGAFSGLTFTNTATTLPPISIQAIGGGKVKLTWSLGTLQSATNVAGPYSNLLGVSSPYTNTATGATFYRTKL